MGQEKTRRQLGKPLGAEKHEENVREVQKDLKEIERHHKGPYPHDLDD